MRWRRSLGVREGAFSEGEKEREEKVRGESAKKSIVLERAQKRCFIEEVRRGKSE